MFCQQLSSGEIAPFSIVQLELIFNPTKPGNALAEFEISFSDPLSPPVSRKVIYCSLPYMLSKWGIIAVAMFIWRNLHAFEGKVFPCWFRQFTVYYFLASLSGSIVEFVYLPS